MLPTDTLSARQRRLAAMPIEALDLGDKVLASLHKARIRTIAQLRERWATVEAGGISGIGAATAAALWNALSRHLSGRLPIGGERGPNDPTPEEIEQLCIDLQRGWHPRRLSPEPAPIEMCEQADPRRLFR